MVCTRSCTTPYTIVYGIHNHRLGITIYECCSSTVVRRVAKEKEITRLKAKLIETFSKVLELVSGKKA